MTTTILPIGSIISVENQFYMITGHHVYTYETTMTLGYSTLPYPIGCTGQDSYQLIPVNSTFHLVQKGYETSKSTKILNKMQELYDLLQEEVSSDEYMQAMKEIQYFLDTLEASVEKKRQNGGHTL